MSEPRSRLRYVARCYFHQDYDLEAPDPGGVVRKFLAEEESEVSRALVVELEEVLRGYPTEDQLRERWLTDAGAAFDPGAIGLTYREWFLRMLEILRTTPGG